MNQPTPHYEFDRDTRLEPVGEGTFLANITDRWNAWNGPNGGYVASIAARALHEVMPFGDPLTSTAHFLRPTKPGEARIETQLLREGKRFGSGLATIFQEDKPSLLLVSTFSRAESLTGETHDFDQMPDLPPIEDCVDPTNATPFDLSLADRVSGGMKEFPGWMRGEPSGKPQFEFWLSFADGRPPDSIGLIFLADATPPTVLEMGMAGATIELTVHVRSIPRSRWLAYRKRTRHVMGRYFEEDCDIWDADGRFVAQSRQLATIL